MSTGSVKAIARLSHESNSMRSPMSHGALAQVFQGPAESSVSPTHDPRTASAPDCTVSPGTNVLRRFVRVYEPPLLLSNAKSAAMMRTSQVTAEARIVAGTDNSNVDPALMPLVEGFPPIDVTAETLAGFRAAMIQMSVL